MNDLLCEISKRRGLGSLFTLVSQFKLLLCKKSYLKLLRMPMKTNKTRNQDKVLQNTAPVTDNTSIYTQIVALREDKGLSYAKIAKEVDVSKSTVHKYLKMWREKTPVEDVSLLEAQRRSMRA